MVVQQGLDLMLYGMGVVVVFLTLLVVVTAAMSVIVQRWFPEDDHARGPEKTAGPVVDDHIVAVIQAAIDKHRKKNR
jgi:oxaloacetate decarboxylase gamma subunit